MNYSLGKLKVEAECDEVHALLPKCYMLTSFVHDETGNVIAETNSAKVKGVRQDQTKLTKDNFTDCLFNHKEVSAEVTSFRYTKPGVRQFTQPKIAFRFPYLKRPTLRDGIHTSAQRK